MSGHEVLRAIQEASSPTSSYRQEADDWLQAFIKSDDGWMLMGWIGSDVEDTVQFFACHAIKLKIATSYYTLSEEHREQVWRQLLLKTQILHKLPRAATLQFCWAVAKACPYHSQSGMVQLLENGYIDSRFSHTLEIVHNVGDDAYRVMCDATEFDKHIKVSYDQIDEGDLRNVENEPLPVDTNPLVIVARLCASQVVSWLSSAIEAHPSEVNRINSCFAMWVPFIPANQISSCLITKQCLDNILQLSYTESSADVWIAISRFCTHEVAAEMYSIMPPTVLSCDRLKGAPEEVVISVSRAVCAIGKANARNFVHQLRQESVRTSLHIFSNLIGSSDDEVSASAGAVLTAVVSQMDSVVRDVPVFHEIIPTILKNILSKIELTPTKIKSESREQDEERCEIYRDCIRLTSRVASDSAMSSGLEMLRSVMKIAGMQKKWDFVSLEAVLSLLMWIQFPLPVSIAGVECLHTQLITYVKNIAYSFPFEQLARQDTTSSLLETLSKLLTSADISGWLKHHASTEQVLLVVDIIVRSFNAEPTPQTARCFRNLCLFCNRRFLKLGSVRNCPSTPTCGTPLRGTGNSMSVLTPSRQIRTRGGGGFDTPAQATPGSVAAVARDFEYTQEYMDLEEQLCSVLVTAVRNPRLNSEVILLIGQGVADVIQQPILCAATNSSNLDKLVTTLVSDCFEGSINAGTALGALLRVASNLCNVTNLNVTLLLETWTSYCPRIMDVISFILTPSGETYTSDEVLSACGLIMRGLMGALRGNIAHNLGGIFTAVTSSLRFRISASMFIVLGDAVHYYRINSNAAPLLKQTILDAVGIARDNSDVVLRNPDVAAAFFSLLRFAVLTPYKHNEVNYLISLFEEDNITDWLTITSTVLHNDILSVPSLRVMIRFVSTLASTKFINTNIELVLTIVLRSAISKPVDLVRSLGYVYDKIRIHLSDHIIIASLRNVRCPESLISTLQNELSDSDSTIAMTKFHYASKQLKQS